MTLAIKLLKKHSIAHSVHEYTHDPDAESYGLEAAEKMGVPAEQVFKTLVVSLDKATLAVAVLPVSEKLSMKRIAKAYGAKKATMADKDAVMRSTGYVLGGVSPLGQKKRLNTVIHKSAKQLTTLYISAGRRGLEVALAPTDLQQILHAHFADIVQSE